MIVPRIDEVMSCLRLTGDSELDDDDKEHVDDIVGWEGQDLNGLPGKGGSSNCIVSDKILWVTDLISRDEEKGWTVYS